MYAKHLTLRSAAALAATTAQPAVQGPQMRLPSAMKAQAQQFCVLPDGTLGTAQAYLDWDHESSVAHKVRA